MSEGFNPADESSWGDLAVQAILRTAKSGKIGDGEIFLSRVDEAIRIRNEDRGDNAL